MKAEAFEMIELLDREALDRHPVWAPYRPEDRAWILGWGVPPEQLDVELARYEYCGPEPLFPVLECERLPERGDLIVAARFQLGAGGPGAALPELPGWRLPPFAFGVFVEAREFVFNQQLPGASRRSAERLAAALGLGLPPEALFPMHFTAAVAGPDGQRPRGELPAPW